MVLTHSLTGHKIYRVLPIIRQLVESLNWQREKLSRNVWLLSNDWRLFFKDLYIFYFYLFIILFFICIYFILCLNIYFHQAEENFCDFASWINNSATFGTTKSLQINHFTWSKIGIKLSIKPLYTLKKFKIITIYRRVFICFK